MIKAKIKPSAVHGLGLFAEQFIPKGAVVWKFSPLMDRELTPAQFNELSKEEQDYLLYYGYFSKKSGNYHLSFDDVKFINHSTEPNVAADVSAVDEIEYPVIAIKDIQPGEEILQNYKDFEESGHGL